MALPLTNLTAHYDASDADHLFKTFVSGGPHTGTPVDGDTVAVWTEEGGADRIFKQSASNPLPVWRATTPLLPLPCLDFTGSVGLGQRLVLTNNAGTSRPLSEIITASASTLLIAFWAETIRSTNPASFYTADSVIADVGGYWGVFLNVESGVARVYAYNYDGTQDYVSLPVTIGAPHVLSMRHQGGTLYASLDGGADSSVASGNTSVLTNAVQVGVGSATVGFDGRIGEIAIYNTALTGTPLTDAISYFTTKWLTVAVPERVQTFLLLPM